VARFFRAEALEPDAWKRRKSNGAGAQCLRSKDLSYIDRKTEATASAPFALIDGTRKGNINGEGRARHAVHLRRKEKGDDRRTLQERRAGCGSHDG